MAKHKPIRIPLPEFCLVTLIGASGSGKSTFAREHFLPTEVLSSDFFRGMVSDDENSLPATGDAFEALHFVAAKRLAGRKMTVIDATSVQAFGRKPLVKLAREYHVFPVAIVLDIPEAVCRKRNESRTDRNFGDHVIGQQTKQLKQSLRRLKREGFRRVFVLKLEEDVASVEIERERVWPNKRDEHGPFDIIGDVHGCDAELDQLLIKLGYTIDGASVVAPEGRKAVFVGDLVDRGPGVPAVLRRVMGMVESGTAICVPGNHDDRLARALSGKNPKRTHGLQESLDQLEDESAAFRGQVADFIGSLVSHYVFDEGKLVVAHAGMKEELAGRTSGAVRSFALYGETTGEVDDFGLPVRLDWAGAYRGKALTVYGHTPVADAEWLNNTVNIDTGCVFGGKLTALRYPEQELVSVEANRTYAEPVRPFLSEDVPATVQQAHDAVLDIDDVRGKQIVETRFAPSITIREDRAVAALEVMSRYAIDPRWLIYLPPTMSPSKTSPRADLLEHPDEVFDYYAESGVERVVCEEKHMGSRAMVVVCKDASVAVDRFGVEDDGFGVCYTRTGRRFFEDDAIEHAFLQRIQAAATASGLWDELDSGWVLLDCELMPWSSRAQQLLQDQYAAVGASANASLDATVRALEAASSRGIAADSLLGDYRDRQSRISQYVDAYRSYCWPVQSIDDLKLAPFHLMASEGGVHHDRPHAWHLEILGKLCAGDPGLLLATNTRSVALSDQSEREAAVEWWHGMTEKGGEGMVVKPEAFVSRNHKGLVQPAMKCRGREYLRIIYGPDYTTEAHIAQLSRRNVRAKQSLAIREFALGLEGLERFVAREPLRRVHQCVFGVLALESEPVDPRL